MPEVGVDYFKRSNIQEPVDKHSTDAPTLPKAISDPTPIQPVDVPTEDIMSPSQQLATPYQLRRINLAKIESRQDLMRELNANLPLNEYNLPRYIYRCDLLDYHLLLDLPEERIACTQDMFAAATILLDYTQGFPTLPNGMPMWSQFAHETKEAYAAFLHYLDQAGARTFHHMQAYQPEMLMEWYNIYVWSFRARAYDMFKSAHHARMREQRIMSTENNHYLESEKLFSRVAKALGTLTDDKLAEVEPEKLVSMLERVVRIQRSSAGLAASGGDTKQAPQNVSLEVTMKQIAATAGTQHTSDDEAADTAAILSDPENILAAQELIVKVSGGQR